MTPVNHFPKLTIHSQKLKENTQLIMDTCGQLDIQVSGVVKGTNGYPGVLESMIGAGMTHFASSRLDQLSRLKSMNPDLHTLALRIPMLSELEDLVEVADCSLNSEQETLAHLNQVCQAKGITHEVILMCDLGDLREGYFSNERLLEAAHFVEEECPHLYLKGIGTNLGCFGSVRPDKVNLQELVENARLIEESLRRPLDWVSGGASSSLPLVLNKDMPEGINHLRIGNSLFLRDMEEDYDFNFQGLHGDIFTLEGEIIEVRNKPTYPIGDKVVDAFGDEAVYQNKGIRRRAILAMGRQDLGDMTRLLPLDPGISLEGGSSDHTIVDVTDSDRAYQVGDIISFNILYEHVMFATGSPYIHKEII